MNKKLYKYPELLKYLWLELSLVRVIVLPIIVGAIIFTTFNTQSYRALEAARYVSAILFIMFTIGWGGKLASDSIVDEFTNNTWTLLKMTPITPIQMLTGKLFGSTIYSWYGGIISFIFYIIFSLQLPYKTNYIIISLMIFLFAIATQAAVIATNLITVEQKGITNKLFTLSYQAIIVTPIIAIIIFTFDIANNYHILKWYRFYIPTIRALLFLSVFITFWVIIALYRNIKKTLQLPSKPFVWPFFIITTYIVLVGLMHNKIEFVMRKSTYVAVASQFGIFLTIIIIYITIFLEAKNRVTLRKLYRYLINKKFKQFYFEAPIVIHTIPFLIIFLIIFISTPVKNITDIHLTLTKTDFNFFNTNLLLYLIRDGFMLFSISIFSSSGKWGDIGMIVYMGAIHILSPIIFLSLDKFHYAGYFSPFFDHDVNKIATYTPVLLVEVVLGFLFLRYLWKKRILLKKNETL